MPPVELRQLEYAVTVADELSFRRAAERLGVAQSGLSQQVKRLERELGALLFTRSTHHVAVTVAGAAFVREARRTLEAAERARQAARSHAPDDGRLVVCVGNDDMDTMPTLIDAVRSELPGLEVTMLEGGLPLQRRLFHDGELDLGLALLDGDPGPGLAARLLRREPIGAVLAESHRLASGDQLRWRDLAGETLLVSVADDHPEYNDFVDGVLAELGVVARTEGCASMRDAVASAQTSEGILCVPELPVLPPGLTWRPLIDPVVGLPTSLVWRRHDDRPALRRVLDVAPALARRHGWL